MKPHDSLKPAGTTLWTDTLLSLIALLPWWASVATGIAGYFWLHSIAVTPLDAMLHSGQASVVEEAALWVTLATLGQYLLPLLCLVAAAISAFQRDQAAQRYGDVASRCDDLSQIDWREFELLVTDYFRRQGFLAHLNGGGGADGGVDVVLQKGQDHYLVQCKHWRALRVGVQTVRELYGLMAAQRMAGGFVVTSGEFTAEARNFAQGREIVLINGRALEQGLRAQGHNTVGLASTPRQARPLRSTRQPAPHYPDQRRKKG